MRHDREKSQKVREKMAVNFNWYGNDGCSFKLIIQKCIYEIIPKKKRRSFEVNFDVIWSKIQVRK